MIPHCTQRARDPNSDLTSAITARLQKRRDSGYDQGIHNIPLDTTDRCASTVESEYPASAERFEEFSPSPSSTVEGDGSVSREGE